jgi:UDP-glucose 4-epimerase
MVVPRFIEQALAGEPITVYGNGQQSRCFTYVGDAVELLMRLALDETAVGEVYNVGNPGEITIANLAERIIDITGSQGGIKYIPYEEAYEHGFEDMDRRVPDIAKITALTGYTPQYSLDEALRLTRDWFVEQNQANSEPLYQAVSKS